jgi:hypothetical protein
MLNTNKHTLSRSCSTAEKNTPKNYQKTSAEKKAFTSAGLAQFFQNDKKRNNFTIFFSPPKYPICFSVLNYLHNNSFHSKKKKVLSRSLFLLLHDVSIRALLPQTAGAHVLLMVSIYFDLASQTHKLDWFNS